MTQLLNSLKFDSFGESNVRLYYWISGFGTAWFQVATWVLFALFYISEFELGVYEALAFGIGLLVEVPSGAIADLLGKKRTIILGLFLKTFGSLLFTLGFLSKWLLFAGNIMIVGLAFPLVSGAFEALVYDTLLEKNKEKHYEYISSRVTLVHILVLFMAGLVGGLMWRINTFLPWIASTVSFFIAFILTFWLTEPTIDSEVFSFENYKKQLRIGVSQLKLPDVKPFVVMFIAIFGVYEMWSAGIVRIFMGTGFGFDGEELSYVASVALLVGASLVYILPKIRKRLGDIKSMYILLGLLALGFLSAALFENKAVGLATFIVITVVGNLIRPWISIILNAQIESRYRATTISTLQVLIRLPYVIVALFIGYAAKLGLLQEFYLIVAIGLVLVGLMSKLRKYEDVRSS